ncbi:alpha/beta hydrolase [Myroides sp. WP-1]|uniref:alpha/beta hydrolase n=1 Tax=Myroides sp. WP-1 TaxID=2759944 RepID=UPI0015F85A42|nr:alpha/beta hydrolase-fold protein [Myroides sp. WP-1]MBB1138025.1 alpha/beta hydrolase [Myroides sp. WP-1]
MNLSILRLVALAFGCFATSVVLAQTPIVIGHEYEITSKVLSENRKIQVYLPPSYTDSTATPQSYPVVYLLDSESNFNYLTAYMEKLAKYPYPAIPEMIVVGVVNTNRTRDLTPTSRKEEVMTVEQKAKIQGEAGGNDLFFQFMATELKPFVHQQFRASDYAILIGHSFGGITALNNLLNYTSMFQAYIVHDPSIWWDDRYILKAYEEQKTKDFQHRKVFLTQVGDSENKGHLEEHYSAIQAFNTLIQQQAPQGLLYQYKQYTGENHGSIPLKGNLDGLRYIFEDYPLNFKAIKNNPKLVEESFARLSQNLNFDFQPSEAYLRYIITYYNKQKEKTIVDYFIAYCKRLYPTTTIEQSIGL